MTTVVLTRPQADSERLSRDLQCEGFKTRVMPIMTTMAMESALMKAMTTLMRRAIVKTMMATTMTM